MRWWANHDIFPLPLQKRTVTRRDSSEKVGCQPDRAIPTGVYSLTTCVAICNGTSFQVFFLIDPSNLVDACTARTEHLAPANRQTEQTNTFECSTIE